MRLVVRGAKNVELGREYWLAVKLGKKELFRTQTVQSDCTEKCIWEEAFELDEKAAEEVPEQLCVKLYQRKFKARSCKIGQCPIDLTDLRNLGSEDLMLCHGYFEDVVVGGKAFLPVLVTISVEEDDPAIFQEPAICDCQASKHVMFITRGTRGDVQPFVALARGLAESLNWKITIVTERHYKKFVDANSSVRRGEITWKPSGGNTQRRVDSKIAQWAIHLKGDFMQRLMLARSEREFFRSEPAIFYWAKELKPDLLVFGFTQTAVTTIVSEALQIPLMGYVLQPTLIPSKHYPPLLPLYVRDFEKLNFKKDLQQHKIHHVLKSLMENSPSSPCINSMRKRRGLPVHQLISGVPSYSPLGRHHSWQEYLSLNLPAVIPIDEHMFGGKPADWSENVEFSTNIFLRRGDTKLEPAHEKFILRAKALGKKVVALAFSSMPITKREIISTALQLINKSEVPVAIFALVGSGAGCLKEGSKLGAECTKAVEAGQLLIASGAPYESLFPLMDVIVSHGGLGTTAEALLAGVPVIITGVLLFDQRFWGYRCHSLGVGPPPLHISEFRGSCVELIDKCLTQDSLWAKNAKLVRARLLESAPNDPTGLAANVYAVGKASEKARPFAIYPVGKVREFHPIKSAMGLRKSLVPITFKKRHSGPSLTKIDARSESPNVT